MVESDFGRVPEQDWLLPGGDPLAALPFTLENGLVPS